jgi:hypothetical protein
MPCHGDRGQGLTDEFRTRQYPPEDTNCWDSGCHGARPYSNGFTLPKTVPAVIGSEALQRFDQAQNLYDFIRSAMPYNAPGSLPAIEYLQLTAFLLERNGLVTTGTTLALPSLSTLPVRRSASDAPAADPSPSGAVIGAVLIGLSAIGLRALRQARAQRG